ncbi:hypothetical protein PoB_006786000 [Plakobranchus ocellatus]|uniref:Uncharacterized protein n=1 Tax=Plakobranchus ocellatus TaxID=259542 RepID=A0AAV4DBN3_9GAST|nr:hypothetical protein PoB_006786000 [Plakobranchus ocellatus]
MAPPFLLSNRATDVRPSCKTQRIAPTFRQDESRSRFGALPCGRPSRVGLALDKVSHTLILMYSSPRKILIHWYIFHVTPYLCSLAYKPARYTLSHACFK